MTENNHDVPNPSPLIPKTQGTGRIYLHGTHLALDGKDITAKIELQSTLPIPVTVQRLPVSVVDPEGNPHVQGFLELMSLGVLTPNEKRISEVTIPWPVNVDQPTENHGLDGWQLIIDAKQLDKVSVTPALSVYDPDELLTAKGKKNVEQQLLNLPMPNQGELKIIALTAEIHEAALLARLLLCNGSDREMRLTELPISIVDKLHRKVATGSLTDEQLHIPPYTARVVGTAFPPESIQVSKPNLTSWTIEVEKK